MLLRDKPEFSLFFQRPYSGCCTRNGTDGTQPRMDRGRVGVLGGPHSNSTHALTRFTPGPGTSGMVRGAFPRHKQLSYLAVCTPEISLLHSTDSGRNFWQWFSGVGQGSFNSCLMYLHNVVERHACSQLARVWILHSHDNLCLPQKVRRMFPHGSRATELQFHPHSSPSQDWKQPLDRTVFHL